MSDANEQHHSIQEMVFDVQFNSEEEAFRFQRGFSDLAKEKLLAITEKVFNELAPVHQLVKIKSLTIDLETIDYQKFEADIPELYELRLREALRGILFRLKGTTYSAVDEASITSPALGMTQLLSFFLKTGTIPWWAKSTWQAYLKQEQLGLEEPFTVGKLFTIVFEKNPELFSQLIARHQEDASLLYRLADQIPDKQLLSVIQANSIEQELTYKRILEDVEKLSTPRLLTLHHSQVRALVWQVFFLNWEQDNETSLVKMVVEKLFSLVNKQVPEIAQYLLQINLKKHRFKTSLAQALKQLTNQTSEKVIAVSETKIEQLLRQVASEQETRMLVSYVKRLLEVAPTLKPKEVWALVIDFLSENKGKRLNLQILSTQILPQLTPQWQQVIQRLQIKLNPNLLTIQDFDPGTVNITGNNIANFLKQILTTEQALWVEQYGKLLIEYLDKPMEKVWEILLEVLWENRHKAFTRETFLQLSFPRIWKQLVPIISIGSDVAALQGQKMWEKAPLDVIGQLNQQVPGFAEIDMNYWQETLKISSSDAMSTTDRISTGDRTSIGERVSSTTSKNKGALYQEQKERFTKAYSQGNIRQFIEQLLPGQSIWLEQYVETLGQIMTLDKKVIWELIIDEIWENHTKIFDKRLFLIGSFGRLVDKQSKDIAATWTQIKYWIGQIIQSFPEFAQIQEEALLNKHYDGVTQKRDELVTQPVSQDIQRIITNLFTKGILPAAAQIQRQLGMFLQRPMVSMEETIINLIETALNQTSYTLETLLKPLILQRLVEQTSQEFVEQLLEQLKSLDANLEIPDLSTLSTLTAQVNISDISNDVDALVYYLQYYLRYQESPSPNLEIKQLVSIFRERYIADFESFVLALSTTDIDLLVKVVPEMVEWVQEVWQKTSSSFATTVADDTEEKAQERETFERIKAEIFKSAEEQKRQLIDQAVYVENAGLVILHPYLVRLFEMLKFTETTTTERPSKKDPQKIVKKKEVKFKGDVERERAVYVLQYLATKTETAEEHALTLNKILCGMDITAPFASGKVTLTDEEKETCENMLEAVVQNWTVLQDSPPDMLRGSFFMREGRLELKPSNWRLKIEETGVDMLLHQLPWSIGMIKLPWMENVLNVDWV